MKHHLLPLVMCLLAGALPQLVVADDDAGGPAADRPELQVLDRLRGEWTGTLDGDTSGKQLKLNHRWILSGQTLESKLTFDGTEILMLRTYDAVSAKYVVTCFTNDGTVLLMQGEWDESQQQLSASTRRGGDPVSLTTQFVDETTVRWTLTSGTITLSGINRRLKR